MRENCPWWPATDTKSSIILNWSLLTSYPSPFKSIRSLNKLVLKMAFCFDPFLSLQGLKTKLKTNQWKENTNRLVELNPELIQALNRNVNFFGRYSFTFHIVSAVLTHFDLQVVSGSGKWCQVSADLWWLYRSFRASGDPRKFSIVCLCIVTLDFLSGHG